jgi:translocation and assembly module TamB
MIVKLYSEPPLPSAILSYIVLGQPLAYNEEQSGRLTQAAGQLPSTTGYRPIPTGPSHYCWRRSFPVYVKCWKVSDPGFVHQYRPLLISDSNLLRVRYSPSRRWEIETQTGTESGGDIFYRISFE